MRWSYPILPEQLAKAQSDRRFDSDSEWLASLAGVGEGGGGGSSDPPPLSSFHNGTQEVVGGLRLRQPVVHRRPLEPPSLTWAEGGTLLRLKCPWRPEIERTGKREAIKGFSLKSQANLLDKINSIDVDLIHADRISLATLTYPRQFVDPREAKANKKALVRKMFALFGRLPVMWKLEPQKRAAPHFHLLIFAETPGQMKLIRDWIPLAWYQIAGQGDVKHLKWHLGQYCNKHCVELIRNWGGVRSYAAKYCAKPIFPGDERLAGWEWPGRFWGFHNFELLPVKLHTWNIPQRKARLAKRVMRRWFQHQWSGVVVLTHPRDPQFIKRVRLKESSHAYYRSEGYQLFLVPRKRKGGGRGGMRIFAPPSFTKDLLRYLDDGPAAGGVRPPAYSPDPLGRDVERLE